MPIFWQKKKPTTSRRPSQKQKSLRRLPITLASVVLKRPALIATPPASRDSSSSPLFSPILLLLLVFVYTNQEEELLSHTRRSVETTEKVPAKIRNRAEMSSGRNGPPRGWTGRKRCYLIRLCPLEKEEEEEEAKLLCQGRWPLRQRGAASLD